MEARMIVLVIGLLVFLVPHSARIFANDWRSAQIARIGEQRWKGAYALVSVLGLLLIIWGFSLARSSPVQLWAPPGWGRYAATLLNLLAFILIAAAYVPRNHFKSTLGHPMLAGTSLWAFAHLLSNGSLGAVLLFGAFLAWAVIDFLSSRRRDAGTGTVYPPGTLAGDAMALAFGIVAFLLFGFFLHYWLIGVAPFA
jgi:uncharacterized membrane protein